MKLAEKLLSMFEDKEQTIKKVYKYFKKGGMSTKIKGKRTVGFISPASTVGEILIKQGLLGKTGGNITLDDLSDEDVEKLSKIFVSK